jgi:DNA-binding beta-propeller fold protein YncE
MKNQTRAHRLSSVCASALLAGVVASAGAQPRGFLETVRHHATCASTVSENGDLNPYAIIVAPVTAGKINRGDVLIDNFNNISNLQGTGTTIVDYNPRTKKTALFAKLPRRLPDSGVLVGLSTAMTMLQSGWVIVGSTPSTDGTMGTKTDGALIVLDPNSGKVVATWTGPNINDPWGNVALVDRGATASLFVSMAGFDVPSPNVHDDSGSSVTVRKAKVIRFDLSIAEGKPPVITAQTVVADGFGQRADRDSFLIGPTGLALSSDNKTLYISDALGNRIVAIDDPLARTTSAGSGRTVSKDGLMRRPLSLLMLPNGHLLAANAQNGQVVEIDPEGGRQIYAQWLDADQAQSPPGNGDLFGMALTLDGKSLYYVEDDVAALMEAKR